jgi:hypothetical protein
VEGWGFGGEEAERERGGGHGRGWMRGERRDGVGVSAGREGWDNIVDRRRS